MAGLVKKLPLLGGFSTVSEAYLEVIDLLRHLRDSQEKVNLQFKDGQSIYSSIVTAFSAKHRVMVVGGFTMNEPDLLNEGKGVLLTTEKQGREIALHSKFLEPLVPNLDLGYELRIPKSLGSKQSRGAVRMLLDEFKNRVNISLQDSRKKPIEGVVSNISRLGVGMKTHIHLPDLIAQNRAMMDCKVELEHKEINCKMEIRNQYERKDGNGETYIGGRIIDIARRDMLAFTNFVAKLQKEYVEAHS